MSDELSFWTRLTHWRFVMNLKAADGQEARVTVRLHDGESFEPFIVSLEPPWVLFQAPDGNDGVRVIAVQESAIARIDVALGPKDDTGRGLSVRSNLDQFFEDVPEA
jgi:hypothetical protein